jgi:hypothetical protein
VAAATSTRKQRDEDGMQARFTRAIGTFLILFLPSCATQYAHVANEAKASVVGFSRDDILMCAGHPTTIDKSGKSEIWMYEHGAVTPGGVTPTLVTPYGAGASLAQSAGQYCRVQLRLDRGRVTQVTYAGDTDYWGARDVECAPIMRNCLEYHKGR